MKWAVKIAQTSLSERNLGDILKGLKFRREESEVGSVLAGSMLDECDGALAAFEVAKKVRSALMARSALPGENRVDPEFRLGAVYDFSQHPPSCHHVLEARGVESRAKVGTVHVTIDPPEGSAPEREAEWRSVQAEAQYQHDLHRQSVRVKACFRSASVEKALALLAEPGLTGEILYKVYELAEGDPKQRGEFHKRMGISQAEFDRFKDVIHNPKVSGDWARHAREDPPRTARPMSRQEAERFVRAVVERWIETVAEDF